MTFLSDARQAEVDFLNSSAVILNKFLSIVSTGVKTLTSLAVPRHIKRQTMLTSG